LQYVEKIVTPKYLHFMKKLIVVLLLTAYIMQPVFAQIYIDKKPKKQEKVETQQKAEEAEKKVVEKETKVEETVKKAETPTKQAETQPSSTPKSTSTASAEKNTPATGDVPENAEPGKCYAKCNVADKYDIVKEEVVVQPRTIKKERVAAQYKTVIDTVMTQPKTIKKARTEAVYEIVKEEVMVTPATTKWVKGKSDVGCLSPNPKDCEVLVLVEIPAVYKTVEKKILKEDEVIEDVVIPGEYAAVKREVLEKEESFKDIEMPAQYKVVEKKVMVEKGGYQVWREVICAEDFTASTIKKIQEALAQKGYQPGPADGILGARTKAELFKFQKDEHLPNGNLSIETLKKLGVM
jgi:hypothetical protein